MAEAESVTIQSDGDGAALHLRDVFIRDDEVVDYFDEETDAEAVRRVLRVGVRALSAAGTTRDVDFVEQRFTKLRTAFEEELDEFEEKIERTFKEDQGTVPRILDDHVDDLEATLDNHLGEEGEFIREALDHDDSPINSVTDEIKDLRDEFMKEEGRVEERRKGTQKGYDFEDQLAEVMQETLTGPMDDLESTGGETGGKGKSKKGDFLITTSRGEQIAIEAKRRESPMSKDEIGDYLEEVLQNREADYAIMVMRNADAVPISKMGWFHEYDRRRLCIVLSTGPDDDPEWRFLRFAYSWARARVAQSRAGSDNVDSDAINQELEALADRIDEFESIVNTARTIQENAKDIEDELHGMERAIVRRLHRVKAEIGAKS
jgi:hypothetical protein